LSRTLTIRCQSSSPPTKAPSRATPLGPHRLSPNGAPVNLSERDLKSLVERRQIADASYYQTQLAAWNVSQGTCPPACRRPAPSSDTLPCPSQPLSNTSSATEQYLISSSGQAYLTEQLPPLMPPPTTSATVMVHSSETGEGSEDQGMSCPPSTERPPPLGANSRQPSKLSLDLLQQDDEEMEEEEDRQKLLMDARVRMARQDLQDHETTC